MSTRSLPKPSDTVRVCNGDKDDDDSPEKLGSGRPTTVDALLETNEPVEAETLDMLETLAASASTTVSVLVMVKFLPCIDVTLVAVPPPPPFLLSLSVIVRLWSCGIITSLASGRLASPWEIWILYSLLGVGVVGVVGVEDPEDEVLCLFVVFSRLFCTPTVT